MLVHTEMMGWWKPSFYMENSCHLYTCLIMSKQSRLYLGTITVIQILIIDSTNSRKKKLEQNSLGHGIESPKRLISDIDGKHQAKFFTFLNNQ